MGIADRLSQNHCGVTASSDQVLEEIIIDVRDLVRMSGQQCNKPKQLAEREKQTNSPDQRLLHNRPAKQTDEDSQTVTGLFSVCQYDLEDLYVLAFSPTCSEKHYWRSILMVAIKQNQGCKKYSKIIIKWKYRYIKVQSIWPKAYLSKSKKK